MFKQIDVDRNAGFLLFQPCVTMTTNHKLTYCILSEYVPHTAYING